MGAVSIDIHKKERDYQGLSFSNYESVKYLILYRYKNDANYNSSQNLNVNQAGDFFDFNEELIVTYASLDAILKNITMKEKDEVFLDLIFKGYEISDIIEIYKYPRKTAYRILDRIINKIINENLHNWRNTMNSLLKP